MGPWFLAHVPALLESMPGASQILYKQIPQDGADQAELFTLDYVSCLATAPVTWPLAAEYLTWCPRHGRAALQLLLERLPVQDDEKQARRALLTCRKHGLQSSAARH
eukprot:jgi/Botrbrau1/15061/Bobra.118_2s0009.1